MARRKNQPEAVRIKYLLAERLRSIRTELFGERGGPDLARKLGVPIRTWYNYESGVTVPAEVVLRFLELTGVEPVWLLRGEGSKYRAQPPQTEDSANPTASIKALLRTVLDRLESRPMQVRAHSSYADEPDATPATLLEEPPAFAEPQTPEPAVTVASPPYPFDHNDWLAAQSEGRYLRMEGDSMTPIIADGAFVAFADREEESELLESKLVIAWVEGRPIVRWFQRSGRYALLRAENPAHEPGVTLLDMAGPPEQRRLRRVLWIGTPHP